MKTIEPKILKGTRDFGPNEKAKRDYVLSIITSVFQQFGYQPLGTPSIEYAEVLLGKYGDEAERLVYRFKDNGGRDIALRYDLTVSTARFVAANLNTLALPFKRYQIADVWRAERPQKGRYREFTQCDVDVLGVDNIVADAEVAALGETVFKTLGIPVELQVSNRKFLNSVLASVGIASNQAPGVIRVIDKLDKIGNEGVMEELMKEFDRKQVDPILKALNVEGNNQEKLDQLSEFDIADLKEFVSVCDQFALNTVTFVPRLARGLDYYTGTIYEYVCPEVKVGSICGGGRYDNLCGLFSDKTVPGVGWSIGLDRTVLVMDELGKLDDIPTSAQVLVTQFDSSTLAYSIEVANRLWAGGFKAELYTGDDLKLKTQLRYANRKGIPIVMVCGPDEVAQQKVMVKDMASGGQRLVPLDELGNLTFE